MIVDAKIKITNIDKDRVRLDLFIPQFKFQPLMFVHVGFKDRSIKFFSERKDLPNKCITIHKSVIDKVSKNEIPLIRGAIYRCGHRCDCCEEEESVYIYMPQHVLENKP